MKFGRLGPAAAFALAVAAMGVLPRSAKADVTHVVGKGHTLEAIANRYRVTVKSIVEANHLQAEKHLRIGDTLTIPGVTATKKDTKGKDGTGRDRGDAKAKEARGEKDKRKPIVYAMRPRTPNVVHAVRLATGESFVVHVTDRRNHVAAPAVKSFERMLRSTGNLTHPVDPRLIALVNVVSNHFGGRPIQVISGFRPYSPTQHTAHSNHNIGHAMDFRVVGVPNEVVRDYCRTLKNVGVGYYPASTFVHLDVREASAFWIDFSKPGEPPRYNSPNVAADEGTSDVAEDAKTLEAPPAMPGAPGLGAPENDGIITPGRGGSEEEDEGPLEPILITPTSKT